MKRKVTKDIRMEAQVLGLPFQIFMFWAMVCAAALFVAISPFGVIKFTVITIVLVVLYILLRRMSSLFTSTKRNDLPPTIKNR